MNRTGPIVILSLALMWTAIAQEVPLLKPSQMENYNWLTQHLIVPCCWLEPIAAHRSVVAQQMTEEIANLLALGHSENEIGATYVAQYGTRILSDPPGSRGRWRYAVPLALFFPLQAQSEFLALVQKEARNGWA